MGKRLAVTRPIETAGFKWQPETWPMARWTPAARTALPQPPKTSQKVPKNSAAARLERCIVSPALSCGVIFVCEKRTADRGRDIHGAYCDRRMEHPALDARTLLT